jgi:hypothetical protein
LLYNKSKHEILDEDDDDAEFTIRRSCLALISDIFDNYKKITRDILFPLAQADLSCETNSPELIRGIIISEMIYDKTGEISNELKIKIMEIKTTNIVN